MELTVCGFWGGVAWWIFQEEKGVMVLIWKSEKQRFINNSILPSSVKKKGLFLEFPSVDSSEEDNGFAVFIIIPCTLQNPFSPLSDLLLPTATALWGRETKDYHLSNEEPAPRLSDLP